MQKGGPPAARQGIAPRLEAASPVVRQLVALAAGLPLDAGAKKIAEAMATAGKGVSEAAKGILSLGDGDADPADVSAGRQEWAARAEDRLGHLLRFEALLSQSALPQIDRDGMSSWFRSIVDLLMAVKSARQDMARERQSDASPAAGQGPAGLLRLPGEQVQTWRSWLDGCVRALADPAAAGEAAFHALAAKENVNYFELPLPWMPGRALELWVESDGGDDGRDRGDAGKRVLLGMTFSALGETRVGLESFGKRLNVRIWAERTGSIESVLPQLQSELAALGFEAAVSLSALVPQDGPVPSIKSALGGPGLNAVG